MRRGGRSYFRKLRELRAAVAEQDNRELDYDCIDRMSKVDSLDRPWRDLVNEHGFVPVVKCLRDSHDLAAVTRMLKSRHEFRQRQLANGDF